MKRTTSLCAFAIVLTFVAGRADAATITYDDGGTHVVNSAVTDAIHLYDDTGGQTTTLELVAGADVTGQVIAWEHSHVLVSGGQKYSTSMLLFDDSSGAYTGGYVQSTSLGANASLVITGGTINQLETNDNTTVDIHEVTFQGSSIYAGLYLFDDSVISIYGKSLSLVDVVDDVFGASYDKYELTGEFLSGSPIHTNVFFYKTSPGTLSLVNVPEPSTAVLAAFACLACVGLVSRRGGFAGRGLLAVFAASTFFFVAEPATAATITQVGDAGGDVSFSQFDPALGTLQSVRAHLAAFGSVEGEVGYFPPEPEPGRPPEIGFATVSGGGGSVFAFHPDLPVFAELTGLPQFISLHPGEIQFVVGFSEGERIESATNLGPFIGTENVDFFVSAFPGELIVDPGPFVEPLGTFGGFAGGTLTLTYEYEPVPEPASWLLCGCGLMALGGRRWRRV